MTYHFESSGMTVAASCSSAPVSSVAVSGVSLSAVIQTVSLMCANEWRDHAVEDLIANAQEGGNPDRHPNDGQRQIACLLSGRPRHLAELGPRLLEEGEEIGRIAPRRDTRLRTAAVARRTTRSTQRPTGGFVLRR